MRAATSTTIVLRTTTTARVKMYVPTLLFLIPAETASVYQEKQLKTAFSTAVWVHLKVRAVPHVDVLMRQVPHVGRADIRAAVQPVMLARGTLIQVRQQTSV